MWSPTHGKGYGSGVGSRIHIIETCADSAQVAKTTARQRQDGHDSADKPHSARQIMRLTSLAMQALFVQCTKQTLQFIQSFTATNENIHLINGIWRAAENIKSEGGETQFRKRFCNLR